MFVLFCAFLFKLGPPAPKFTHNVANDYKDQRLNSFIENYLDNYDVVCLQEMFGAFSGRRKRLIREARKRGFLWKVSSAQNRSSMYLVDGGCLILSKVKIVSEAFHVFPPGIMSDRLAAKGVIYAKLNPKPNVYVHLFVTHLQAVYSDSSSMKECMNIQRIQYDSLADFVLSTVAENESSDDMLLARFQDTLPPVQQHFSPVRRWPIIVSGDFNCNSRPAPGDLVNQTTRPYKHLCESLAKISPNFSDVLFDQLGEHPVTYASAKFALNGSFFPHETALTSPSDYHESAEWVNQCLDYLFLFPPEHVVHPETLAVHDPVLKTIDAGVKHLQYVPAHNEPRSVHGLVYLSDHWALEAAFDIL